ncbi:hypothetical protein D3C74_459550 [compost metagenome]
MDWLEEGREEAFGIDVGAGGNANGSGHRRTEIREDIAKEVRSDHHIKPVRMQDKVRGQDIDMEFIHRYTGVIFGHRGHAGVPVWHGDGNAVGLGS